MKISVGKSGSVRNPFKLSIQTKRLNLKHLGARYRALDNTILSNLPVNIPLIKLACVPFFLLQNQEGIANQNAKYAFYLLINGVLRKIIQYFMIRHGKK